MNYASSTKKNRSCIFTQHRFIKYMVLYEETKWIEKKGGSEHVKKSIASTFIYVIFVHKQSLTLI